MPKLAEIRPKDLLAALQKLGFIVVFKSGSHFRLHHADGRRVTLALHSKPLAKGTLGAILRQAQIARKELADVL